MHIKFSDSWSRNFTGLEMEKEKALAFWHIHNFHKCKTFRAFSKCKIHNAFSRKKECNLLKICLKLLFPTYHHFRLLCIWHSCIMYETQRFLQKYPHTLFTLCLLTWIFMSCSIFVYVRKFPCASFFFV